MEPEVTPELIDDVLNHISYVTYRSAFDNELLDVDSELNMTAYMSEFFDLDDGPEMYAFIDMTIDRIKSIKEALNESKV